MSTPAGVQFFEEAAVTDPDSASRVYRFSVARPEHCACFNIGQGPDGSPLISWSDLAALYRLPDGTTWAEHGTLYDSEDLVRGCAPALEVAACRSRVHVGSLSRADIAMHSSALAAGSRAYMVPDAVSLALAPTVDQLAG